MNPESQIGACLCQEIDQDNLVENILFVECVLVRMCQGHHDNVIWVNEVFIKLEAFIRMMQF